VVPVKARRRRINAVRISVERRKETVRRVRAVHRTKTTSDPPTDKHTTGRCERPEPRDLNMWAAELASTLPPLTESEVTPVARLAARLDAASNQEPAA
jgi:hypothetical protein